MGKDIRIIIAGGRKFNDYDTFKDCMKKWNKHHRFKEDDKITVVCGCADGVDLLGKKYAEEVGWNVELMPANWNLLGKVAGILRNNEMAKFADGGDEKYLIAVWNGKSKGTKNMIDTAIQHNINIHIFSYDDIEENAVVEYIGDIMDKAFDIFNDSILKDKKDISDKSNESFNAGIDYPGNLHIEITKI